MDQANTLRDLMKKRYDTRTKASIQSRVIAISSGKGGVGKSNIAVNLAICMAQQGKRVVIVDADFGLANIEVLLGVIPKFNFRDLIFKGRTVDEVLSEGPCGIRFISGGSGFTELANLNDRQISYVVDCFQQLDEISDVIIIDTGAGISKAVINFICAASEAIIVTTPEPTSVTDAYAIVKQIKEFGSTDIEIKVLVNRADDAREGEQVFERLNLVAKKFLGTRLDYLGFVPFDPFVTKAVKKQVPVVLSFPNAASSEAIGRISSKLSGIEIKPTTIGMASYLKRLVRIFNS